MKEFGTGTEPTYHGHYTRTDTLEAPAFPGKNLPGDQGYGLFRSGDFLGYTKALYPDAQMEPALPWPTDRWALIGKKITTRRIPGAGGLAEQDGTVVVLGVDRQNNLIVKHPGPTTPWLHPNERVLLKVEDADLSGYNAEVANVAGTLKVTRLVAKKAA